MLLVEDDYDVAEMLLMYFKSHQYEVFHADNGHDGIEIARTKFPNLILLDVMLPKMNGYEICAHLRQMSLTKHIPVIFLTQKDKRADKVEGLQLGADDYIAKPFDLDELRLRVQHSIERATRESLHERRTGLPAGPMVEAEQIRAFRAEETFKEHRFVIEGYDTFTDNYGFMAADQVMGFAAKMVREAVLQYGVKQDFIGIVGDEFVVMSHTEDDSVLVEAITDQFNKDVHAFYTFMDVEQGGILVDAGSPQEHVTPIMKLIHLSAQASV